VTLTLSADNVERLRTADVRWLSTLDVEPGAYSVRVTGYASTTGSTGSIFLDLDVPKWEEDTLWIGGLAVTTAAAAPSVTAISTPVELGLPGPPTTVRGFRPGEPLTASAQIVVPRRFVSGTVQMTVRRQFAPRDAPALLERSIDLPDRVAAKAPSLWTIDTAALPAGEYVLQLTLRDDRNHSAQTAMTFEVEP
jgi:hypothetical protein